MYLTTNETLMLSVTPTVTFLARLPITSVPVVITAAVALDLKLLYV